MTPFSRMQFLARSPVRCLSSLRRGPATERTNYVSVTMDPEFGGSVAVLKMQKEPVNSLCANHLLELKKTFTDLESDENVRAVILTSGLQGVFCAGLDINSLYRRTYDEIHTFWGIMQDAYLKMYSSPLILIAAMNGHCIAGGCGVAFSADYRIFAEGCKIGLNEVKLGMPIPSFLSRMTDSLAGPRQSDRLQQLGVLVKSSEALKLGLVDETVPKDEVLGAARKQVTRWLEVPDSARAMSKGSTRKRLIEEFEASKESSFLASLGSSPQVQALIEEQLNKMKRQAQG